MSARGEPQPRGGSDRAAGILLLALAAWLAYESSRFTISFMADPLGPRAVPLFSAALLGLGGALLVARPGAEAVWPDRQARVRLTAAILSFLLYAGLLSWLGFVLATALEIFWLARLFGARLFAGALTATAMSTAFFLLFGYGLGLPLPLGALFGG